MTCPVCGGATKVVDSRPEVDTVHRRRKCKECGYRFSTVEIEVDVKESIAGVTQRQSS